jgi:hypothetical protein
MRIIDLSMTVNKTTRHQAIELRIETVFDEQVITFPVSGAQKDGTTV